MVKWLARTPNRQEGPRPGPEPAWAHFTRARQSAGPGDAGIVGFQAFKPDAGAYRIVGATPRSEALASQAHTDIGRQRNRYNSSVYVSRIDRYGGRGGKTPADALRIPVIGEIAAGHYEVTVAFHEYDCLDYEGGVLVDRALARNGSYALRVRGTSMTHVGIEPGDVVVVRPQNWADDGDFVVAQFTEGSAGGSEGLVTLKRFYRRRDHIFLQSANASVEPIRLYANHPGAHDPDPVRIQGVVTVVLKAEPEADG